MYFTFVYRHDPDILVGYEIQQLSWGFLFRRAAFLDMNICAQVSRLPGRYKCKKIFLYKRAFSVFHFSST